MGGTILLADDSLTIQKVIELTFAETDFDVVAVSSGEELLARLPATRPNVIICDVIMPGKDGYDVCQEIKSNPAVLHIPVILLTGTFEPFDRDRALAAGCSEIITKPFEARRLVETVERLLRDNLAAMPARARATEPGAVEPPSFAAPSSPPAMEFAGAVRPPAPVSAPPAPSIPDLAPFGSGEDDGDEFATRFTAPSSVDAPSAPPAAEVFGRAAAAGDEALDFTATGFAEMNAASELAGQAPATAPDDGLDYDVATDSEPQPAPWDAPAADADAVHPVDRETGPIPTLASYQEEAEYDVEQAPAARASTEDELPEAAQAGYDEPMAPDPFDASGTANEEAIAFAGSPEPWSEEAPAELAAAAAPPALDQEQWTSPVAMAEAYDTEEPVEAETPASPWDTQEPVAAADPGWREPEMEAEPAAEPPWAQPAADDAPPWSATVPDDELVAEREEEPTWQRESWSEPAAEPDVEHAAGSGDELDTEPREEWHEPSVAAASDADWAAPEPARPWASAPTPAPEPTALDTAEWDRGETWVDAPLPPDDEASVSDLVENEAPLEESAAEAEPTPDHEALEPAGAWQDAEPEHALEDDANEVDSYRSADAFDERPDELDAPAEAPFDAAANEPEEPAAAETELELAAAAAPDAAWASADDAYPAAGEEPAAFTSTPPDDERPVEEPAAEPAPPTAVAEVATPAAAAAADAAPATLSDADVERIARRVLELAGGTIERIAWEVIPDMAEIVVRERVRAIEERMAGDESIQ